METQKTICKTNSEWRLKKIQIQFYLLHVYRIVNEFIIVIDVYIGHKKDSKVHKIPILTMITMNSVV